MNGFYDSYPCDIYPRDSYSPRHLPTEKLTPQFTPHDSYPRDIYPSRNLPPMTVTPCDNYPLPPAIYIYNIPYNVSMCNLN